MQSNQKDSRGSGGDRGPGTMMGSTGQAAVTRLSEAASQFKASAAGGGGTGPIKFNSNGNCHPLFDHRNCAKLSSILSLFDNPVSEEQAWALCHQMCMTLRRIVRGRNDNGLTKTNSSASDPDNTAGVNDNDADDNKKQQLVDNSKSLSSAQSQSSSKKAANTIGPHDTAIKDDDDRQRCESDSVDQLSSMPSSSSTTTTTSSSSTTNNDQSMKHNRETDSLDVLISKDGSIHEDSLKDEALSPRVLALIGYTVFDALYYNMQSDDNDDERDISKELEELVVQMIDTDTDPMARNVGPIEEDDEDEDDHQAPPSGVGNRKPTRTGSTKISSASSTGSSNESTSTQPSGGHIISSSSSSRDSTNHSKSHLNHDHNHHSINNNNKNNNSNNAHYNQLNCHHHNSSHHYSQSSHHHHQHHHRSSNHHLTNHHLLNVAGVDSGGDSNDEGIGEDVDGASHSGPESGGSQINQILPTNHITFDAVIQACVNHHKVNDEIAADSHYRAVCRALVADAEGLSGFLEIYYKGQQVLKGGVGSNSGVQDNGSGLDVKLQGLDIQDWARLWMQVIDELRRGVKLKKVDLSIMAPQHPIEYELTPYEMLLDDIRSRKYRLKQTKVMVNGDIPPKVKKDAHDLILDFIRSKPPLRPTAQRKMPPTPPKNLTPHDRLMESLRQPHKLRPTPPSSARATPTRRLSGVAGRALSSATSTHSLKETSRTVLTDAQMHGTPGADMTGTTGRRLIKPDLTLRLSTSFDEDEDSDHSGNQTTQIRNNSLPEYSLADDDDDDDVLQITLDEDNNQSGSKKTPNAGEGGPSRPTSFQRTSSRRFSFKNLKNYLSFSGERRNSITVCETPTEGHRRHRGGGPGLDEDIDFDDDPRDHVARIWAEQNWGKSMQCLSLTLHEVKHMRKVLTKAEIESLGVTKDMHEKLLKGKICFTCLKTHFGLFNWPVKCKICDQSICDKCATSMHIPCEQFEKVPIYMLSPASTPSPSHSNNEHDFNPLRFIGAEISSRSSSSGPKSNDSSLKSNRSSKISTGDDTPKSSRVAPTSSSSSTAADAAQAGIESSKQFLEKTAKEVSRRSRFIKSLTLHPRAGGKSKNDPVIEISETNKRSGPLMDVCRDCKFMVRHLIDFGHANYTSSIDSWPPGAFSAGVPGKSPLSSHQHHVDTSSQPPHSLGSGGTGSDSLLSHDEQLKSKSLD